jgi:DNA polymerase III epsilon subunit family exonuclease
LFAVGDEEQSIFSWAGADPRVLKRFQEETLAQPIVLDKNHRCSRPIFETARRLLRVNPSLFDKALSAERRSDYQVTALAFEDESDEAAWLLEDLRADRERTGLSWGEYAVLYRVHRMGDRLESRLVKSGVPCRLARGRALGEDEVIGWVAASLELMRRPGDPAVVEKLATRVLGEETMELVRGATAGAEDFIASLREFAGGRPAEPLTKLIWRFVFHVENLAALARAHAALEPLVMDVLSQRVGRFTNRLEESHEQLSDPAQAPEALRLANKLRAARDSGARLVVEPMDGLEVGIKGLLHAAGLKVVAYRDEAPAPRLDDVPLGPSDAGPLGLAVTAFKALQLLHAARLGDLFARYVAFDVETSSFDQSLCEVVEIAAARVVGGRVTARFHELVRPERGIRAEAAGVHGITDDEVRDAAPFAEVWRRFRDFVGADTLVAHNGQRFDVPVLRRLAEPLGGAEWLTCFDTLPLARALVDGRARLGVLAERFGIEAGRSHRADADVETLARVFGELEKLRQVRARKSVLVSALDYLGLALALDPLGGASEEQGVLLELSRASTLGRYSDALDFYEAERERRAAAPHLESVIERLGGRNLMDRLRAERRPEERYPAAVARLRLLMEGLDDRPLEEAMEAFLERVALSSSAGPETDPHRVSLLTLHSTKGLEFDRVYIIGVEDEQLPGLRPDDEDPDAKLQEARRLLYVGMTRARERLVLTRATQRFGRPTGGARFLDEMGVEARSVGSPA